ncbi:hypothetical protein FPQ18DRAFT_318429 [Pyronema domesticum]|uniref:Biogenesis of lysosome-related organelles complex 1 subunit CNL1 n=1 Tax=Pyronema omphalodes (strain CBS 100304) TaxID=1076935 RepID=U4LP65_PYROM|nr:hypothetical protein FPQ18DRAFT_318429 [Pyronema domesticum]CCX33740.1 Similar to Biogenesis of lysosome-related organelles complex 1 subunit CNL1; acc. no. C5DJH5 [Pyronema omphalodes CBS 100304]
MSSAFNDHSHHISEEDLNYIARTQRTLTAGRGHSTGSPSSSRRPSTSSTQSGNASISLDPRALSALSAHFDELLGAITTRVKLLSQQTLDATNSYHRRATSVADMANKEMERLRDILRQCDELQNEFLKIKRIGDIVKGFRARVEDLEKRIGK